VPYLRQAGAKAFARSANRESSTCFEQALAALQHLPETRETLEQAIDLRFDVRNSLYPLGELERIVGYLREAERLAKTLDDQRRLGWSRVYESVSLDHGSWTEARRSARAPIPSPRRSAMFRSRLRRITTSPRRLHLRPLSSRRGLLPKDRALAPRRCRPAALRPVPVSRRDVPRLFGVLPCPAGEFDEGIAHGQDGSESARTSITRTV